MNRAQRRASKEHPDPVDTDKVTIGYVHPGEVSEIFINSLLRMQAFEAKENGRFLGTISKRAGTGWIAGARNFVTTEFLKSDSQWLMFIDTDMGWAPWALTRMLSVAKQDGFKPIIGGLTFALTVTDWDPETNGETTECFPVLGIWNRNDGGEILGYRYITKYDKDTVLRMDSTGAAFLLIHRSAFEKVGASDWWTPLEVPEDSPGLEGRGHFSEDVSWWIRVANAGLELWVDCGTRTAHDKGGVHLTEKVWDFQEAVKAASVARAAQHDARADLETR